MLEPAYQPHEIVKIGELLKDRKSASQIAAEISHMRGSLVSRNAIIGKVSRDKTLNAIGFANKPAPKSKKVAKTPEQKADKALKDELKRKSRAMFGTSPSRAWAAMPTDTEIAPTAPIDFSVLTLIPRPRAEDLGNPKIYDAEGRHIPLWELGRHDCRWPVNDAEKGAEHLFCGRPAASERPYCAHHSQRAVQCR